MAVNVQPVPFRVNRTKSSNLPVYINYKSGRTRVITVVRKIDGDLVVIMACDSLTGSADICKVSDQKMSGYMRKYSSTSYMGIVQIQMASCT